MLIKKKTVEQPEIQTEGVSRREFLKDAGLIVGVTVVGSTALLSACSSGPKETSTTGPATTTTTPPVSGETEYSLTVNGQQYRLNLKNNWTLVYVLREKLGLTGTKVGCDRGQCAACTVLADGVPVLSCTMLAIQAAQENKQIETIEGLSDGITLSPLQQAFVDNEAFQCGYCTPGFLMASKGLLAKNPKPTYDEARTALSGHVCICGTIKWVVDTVQNVPAS
jgi:xanthine dehydrogenase YagT iron-sulfur-binding subunit